YNTVDMSHQRMFNEYMLPYQAAVEEGVGSVMASFNEVDGVPATGNKWLMTDVLRKQWNFDGFVVTDYTGITEMTDHGMGDTQTVAALALNAGVDMDMVSDAFTSTLKKSLEEGKVSVKAVDAACRRILEAKYKLGLFDNPYKYCDITRPKKQIFTKEHRAIARKTASESFVLLKNENSVLPLAKKGTIAVVGPLADSRSNMPGTWSVAAVMNKYPSLIEGLKEVVGGKAKILMAKGSNLMSDAEYEERATMFGRTLHRDNRTDKELLDEALAVAAKSDVIVAALGESSEMSGESSCRTDLEMPDTQRALLQELLKTGKPVVLVLFTGRPLVLNWEQENVPAILNVWFGGSEAALAIGDVLFGNVNPSGKLTATFPKSVGQIPLFYNHKNTGRPLPQGAWFQKFRSNYLDVDNEPLYPFGYGLSYTTFSYSDITLDKSSMNINGEITATVTVTNTGKYDGSEVVQLYIRDLIGSVTRPVKELKGFEKIFLKAGESKQVSFKLTADMLKFYNYNLDFVCEPGDFEVMIGGDSRDVNKALFSLQ
ncbi:glycoside hydrolase family 3 C-terminal domain-containing protein, partial [Bacteroides cellulosilyticus]